MPLPSLARGVVAVLVALALAVAFPVGLQAYRDHRAEQDLADMFEEPVDR